MLRGSAGGGKVEDVFAMVILMWEVPVREQGRKGIDN